MKHVDDAECGDDFESGDGIDYCDHANSDGDIEDDEDGDCIEFYGDFDYEFSTFFEDNKEMHRMRKYYREVVTTWKESAKKIKNNNKSILLREARREAVTIIEDAARTTEDYIKVLMIWKAQETIEKWRVKKQEKQTNDKVSDSELKENDVIIPQPVPHIYYRQLQKGDFLDVIFDCPHEIHETTSNKPVFDVTEELDEIHKELLYYRAIRYWSPQQIAKWLDVTDRNIRKKYNKMIDDMRYELFYFLYWRHKKHLPITTTEKAHVTAGIEKHGELEPDMENIVDGIKVNDIIVI